MTALDTVKIEARIARAQAALAAGFTTKAARKAATEELGRAYDEARNAIQSALLATERDAEGRMALDKSALYYDLPYQLNHWRAKHAEAVKAVVSADVGAPLVAIIDRLVALRAEIVAAPELPKPPTKKAIRAETEVRGTCQICARPIGIKAGVIAHHGYQRPGGGWQTASCYGARALPFEQSRDTLGKWIVACVDNVASHTAHAAAIRSETAPATLTVMDVYGRARPYAVTRETHAWVQGIAAAANKLSRRAICTWEERRDACAATESREAAGWAAERTRQQARFDGWVAQS